MIHAVFQTRASLRRYQGGDTVQILRTAEALERLGVRVTIDEGGALDPSGFDLVHLFHLDRPWENLTWAARAKRAAVPIALSPIWWPQGEFDRKGRTGVQGLLARTLGHRGYGCARAAQRSLAAAVGSGPKRVVVRAHRAAQDLINASSVCFPNSAEEEREIRERFRCDAPCVVVPNASNFDAPGPDPVPFADRPLDVLCVGRIEPRKNQLALVEALKGAPYSVKLVGAPGRFSRGYAGKVARAAAGSNITIEPFMEPDALAPLYESAKVHVCCSWYETPGLVSLEAARCGCSIVSTDRGSARSYLGSDAQYCDPSDPCSIRTAIDRAVVTAPDPGLPGRVRASFNWDQAAARTLEGYEMILRKDHNRGAPRMIDP